MSARRLPRYRELPVAEGGARSGWGVFGPEDSVGLMNLIDATKTAGAARLARTGAVFPLDVAAGTIDPPLFGRGATRHTILQKRPGKALDDVHDNFFPQSGSQWDALSHIAYSPDRFYNGATTDDVLGRRRDTVEHWARRGIATRGILLDVADAVATHGGPGASVPVTVADLEAARIAAGVEYEPGDVILVRTGFIAWYREQDAAVRLRESRSETLTAAGIAQGEEMAEYLWDSQLAAVATDTAGFECWPPDQSDAGFPFGFMHQILLGQFGMAIGELWDFEALAADCRQDGIYETFLVSSPINAPGVGSPANALAIK
ncbi:MAG TPA: cyclase family protein [Gryllotalpicola sp.]